MVSNAKSIKTQSPNNYDFIIINKGCEAAWADLKKFVRLPTAEKIG